MNLRLPTLAVAIGIALATPAGFAQNANVKAAVPVPPTQPQDPVPAAVDRSMARTTTAAQAASQASGRAQDKMHDSAMHDSAPSATDQDQSTSTDTDAMQSQGAEHAAAHSDVARRDVWDRLDTNQDGLISATEADADAGFDGGFAAMDADANGSVSEREYTAYAKANMSNRGENAAPHSQAATPPWHGATSMPTATAS